VIDEFLTVRLSEVVSLLEEERFESTLKLFFKDGGRALM